MDTEINQNKELSITEALIPRHCKLVLMLGYNVYAFMATKHHGSNQFVLLLGAAIAAIVSRNKVTYAKND
jgi:NhaC family Na+:H+ antiporter